MNLQCHKTERSEKRGAFSLLAVLLLALLVTSACNRKPDSPEEQVRAVLTSLEAAAREKDLRNLKDHVSERYSDEQRNNKQAVAQLLTYYFFQNRSIHVFTRIRDVTAETPSRVNASVLAALAGSPVNEASELADTNATLYHFDFTFSLEDGDEWKITGASWGPAELDDFF